MTQRKKPPHDPASKGAPRSASRERSAATQVGSNQSRPSDSAFDIWLNRGLHQLFDDVASEPVPEELLKLIEEDRKK